MFNLTNADLQSLKGDGGTRFVRFVDSLILISIRLAGVPLANLRTQLRVNIPDGGVDTAVDCAIASDATGWFTVPTAWQFKSVDVTGIDASKKKPTPKNPNPRNELQEEINKPYVQELIKNGYGYRLCIVGDLTPQTASDWEQQLNEEAKKISADAQPASVVHGGGLRDWAEKYLAVVAQLRDVQGLVLHWEAWSRNFEVVTPNYVPNPDWQAIRDQISKHIDFAQQPAKSDACLHIGGEAGVGKTRLVLETLRDSISPLVAYCVDEDSGKRIASWLANQTDRFAIVVVDECDLGANESINATLRGHTHRVRVITINNIAPRFASGSAQIWLKMDSEKHTIEILRANFSHIPDDRLQRYARFAQGFVRLAADICDHDAEIVAGGIEQTLSSIEQYVRTRLSGDDFSFVALLSLFQKIGCQSPYRSDLEELCKLSGFDIRVADQVVRAVHDSPGFIARQGRFCYATPEIVQKVMFGEGYQRWVHNDPRTFITSLPPELSRQFLEQAKIHGGSEVRAALGGFFRAFFSGLVIQDLMTSEGARFVAALTEIQPRDFLPLLRRLFESASVDELRQITGDYVDAGWGPRRTFVWLFERLAALPDLFADSEACLFRLALAENEPNIGNNATATWRSFFSVWLSGTAVSFNDRLQVLNSRVEDSDPEELRVAILGFKSALDSVHGRIVGPPIVAGRMTPANWAPSNRKEEHECYKAALTELGKVVEKSAAHREAVMTVLFEHGAFILNCGLRAEYESILDSIVLTDKEQRLVRAQLESFLEYHADRDDRSDSATTYIKDVQDWLRRTAPADLDGELRDVYSREPWDSFFRDESNAELLAKIVASILQQPGFLERHLQWLGSAEARSAERLGFALGERDTEGAVGELIFHDAIASGHAPVVRGYVRGMTKSGAAFREPVRELISRMECDQPLVAAEVLTYGGDTLDGLNRLLDLVRTKRLPVRYLSALAMGYGGRNLTRDEVAATLPLFAEAAERGDKEAASAGIYFLSTLLQFEEKHLKYKVFDDERIRNNAWTLVKSGRSVRGRLEYEWSHILEELLPFDAEKVIQAFAVILLSDNHSLRRLSEEKLAEVADSFPTEVMDAIGKALLDTKYGWKLQVSVLRDVVQKIPREVVLAWLEKNGGLEAAKRIARHLPKPFADASGKCVVPPVMEAVFEKYSDEDVLTSFAAGSHSGEVWSGNPANTFRAEAEYLKQLLSHSVPLIRTWAAEEIDYLKASADREDVEHDERFLPGE